MLLNEIPHLKDLTQLLDSIAKIITTYQDKTANINLSSEEKKIDKTNLEIDLSNTLFQIIRLIPSLAIVGLTKEQLIRKWQLACHPDRPFRDFKLITKWPDEHTQQEITLISANLMQEIDNLLHNLDNQAAENNNNGDFFRLLTAASIQTAEIARVATPEEANDYQLSRKNINLKSSFARAIKNVVKNGKYKQREIYVNTDHSSDRQFAVYSHTEHIGNIKREVYNIYYLRSTQLDISKDSEYYLLREFLLNLQETFKPLSSSTLDYQQMLFEHFIHDGSDHPASLKEITISSTGHHISQMNIAKNFKEESNLYSNPTHVFKRTYNYFLPSGGNIRLNGRSYPLANETQITLAQALKEQNFTIYLQLLTKLWIIHQFKAQNNSLNLNNHPFFGGENVNSILSELESGIEQQLSSLLNLPLEQMLASAKDAIQENSRGLSAYRFNLAQRLPLLRFWAGHARNDIHTLKKHDLPLKTTLFFYIKTYLNIELSHYLITRIKKHFQQAKKISLEFSAANARFSSLFKGIFNLLAALNLALCLPFLTVFFALTGITSLPFILIKRLFKIAPASKAEKIVSAAEIIKNIMLGIWFVPLAYTASSALIAFTFDILGIATLASSVTFWAGTFLASPLLLSYTWSCFDNYPGWVTRSNEYYRWQEYREQSELRDMLGYIDAFSKNKLAGLLGLVNSLALIGYGIITICRYFLQKYYRKQDANYSTFTASELNIQKQNPNHEEKFAAQLQILAEHLDAHTLTDNDKQLIAKFNKIKLTFEEQQDLKQHLKQRLSEDNLTPEQRTCYKNALPFIKQTGFIPSMKLVEVLNQQTETQRAKPSLRTSIKRMQENYFRP